MPYCKCCELQDAMFGPRKSPDGLPMDHGVCDLCSRHLGSHESKLRKKERDHREMWIESLRYTVETLTEQHAEELARRDEQEAALQEELVSRPVQVVIENLDIEVVKEAHRKAQGAYRSRDHAFRQLTMIHLQHFEAHAGQCRCGLPIDDCEIALIVDNYRALKTWEYINTERRKRHQIHQLPKHHPGIIDARWDPDEEQRAEFDSYDDVWDWENDRPA